MPKLLGTQGFARCSLIVIWGLIGNILLAGFLVGYYFALFTPTYGAETEESVSQQEDLRMRPDLSGLNVRLSTRSIQPPEDMVKRTIILPGIRGARPFMGEPTRAAILEDDLRRRVAVLSLIEPDADEGAIRAFLLHEFDLESRLPRLSVCTRERGCDRDRTPGTGGLGCVALCLVEVLGQ